MTQIHILGKDITIAFNMSTLIAYEQIVSKPYDPDDIKNCQNRLALFYAAIISGSGADSIEIDDLLKKANAKEIATLDNAVTKELLDFYSVPEAAKDDEPGEEEGETKNV